MMLYFRQILLAGDESKDDLWNNTFSAPYLNSFTIEFFGAVNFEFKVLKIYNQKVEYKHKFEFENERWKVSQIVNIWAVLKIFPLTRSKSNFGASFLPPAK